MPDLPPVTVVEMREYLSAVGKLMDEADQALLVDYLAYNTSAGDLIPGTGGVRKLRWALEGRGKRGGARVIYFYHDRNMPLFLLTAYAKNERSDISEQEKKALKQITILLVETYRDRRR